VRRSDREIEDPGERQKALDRIMAHYGWKGPGDYAPPALASIAVLALELGELTGKKKD
jgi:hypothetical protein